MAHLKTIFNFLKEYNELTNPVVTELEKQKWSLALTGLPQTKEVWSIYHTQENSGELILEVTRPILAPCPPPKRGIAHWLIGKWNNVEIDNISHQKVKISEELQEDGTKSQKEEIFEDDSERVKMYVEWINARNIWRATEFPKKQALDLYNTLFKLYSDIKKEAESVELILGDGHINWNTSERKLDHPVFLQKVSLQFDLDKPAFLIKCEETKPEIYSPMLRVISSINHSVLSEVLQEVEEKQYHIADIENTKGFFQRLITVVSSRGQFVAEPTKFSIDPVIRCEPVLFLRRRTLGYSNLITEIIKDINEKDGKSVPGFFGPMIGEYEVNTKEEIIENNWNQSGMDQDVLLTLPANNEQLKIIKYLNNYGAVLVQGPPGTGKTHTIANLIGHLLSEGNSVLVTSHTEKALTVLKDKVYQELRSLCLSLLSTSSQRKEMDSALFDIAEKGTSIDLDYSAKKIERLNAERKELIAKYILKQEELIKIRALEYKDIVFSTSVALKNNNYCNSLYAL